LNKRKPLLDAGKNHDVARAHDLLQAMLLNVPPNVDPGVVSYLCHQILHFWGDRSSQREALVFALELPESLNEVTNALSHANATNKQNMKVVFFSFGAWVENTKIDSIGNQSQLLRKDARFNEGTHREGRRNCDGIGSFVFSFFSFDDPRIDAREPDALPVIFFPKDMILDADVS
jgi:hypothetical protein